MLCGERLECRGVRTQRGVDLRGEGPRYGGEERVFLGVGGMGGGGRVDCIGRGVSNGEVRRSGGG